MGHVTAPLTLPTPQFLDRFLLQNPLDPVWHLWDRDKAALISELENRAYQYLQDVSQNKATKEAESAIYSIIWMLDRLLPMDNDQVFVPFLGKRAVKDLGLRLPSKVVVSERPAGWAVYAWARRRNVNNRGQIFLIPFDEWGYGPSIEDATEAGWAETCPMDAPASLFDWQTLTVNLPQTSFGDLINGSPRILMAEFKKREPDSKKRRDILLNVVEGNGLDKLDDSSLYDHRLPYTLFLEQIAKDLASDFPPVRERLPHFDNKIVNFLIRPGFFPTWIWKRWDSWSWKRSTRHCARGWLAQWFLTTLAESPYSRESAVFHHIYDIGNYSVLEDCAAFFWIYRHNAGLRHRLIADAPTLEEIVPSSVMTYIDKIIPFDQFKDWSKLISFNGKVKFDLFNWVRPEYRDILQRYHASEDREERECSYQAYLNLLPEMMVMELWEHATSLSAEQRYMLDRKIFAPTEMQFDIKVFMSYDMRYKPDLRLRDPFRFRGI